MNKIIVSLMVFALSTAMPAFAFENGDLQFWNTESIEKKVNDRLKLNVQEELRVGGGVSKLYHEHTDLGFSYNVVKGLDLGLNYRQIYEKKDGKWKGENRPHGNVTLKYAWQGIELKDRNRLELRCRDGKSVAWRYRNKFCVYSPWKWTGLDINPYMADEVFIDFHGEKLTRNRLYTGVNAELLKHLKTDVFYLWELNKKNNDWTYNNVIGVKIKVSF